jgi:hypothetical protein
VSLDPLAFKRIILFVLTQPYIVKSPPTIILPSFCIAKVWTVLLQFKVLNPVSLDPLAFKRIILLAVAQVYKSKAPPTIILPSLCIAKV